MMTENKRRNSTTERVLQHGNYNVNCIHLFGKWMSLENGEEFRVCVACGEARIRDVEEPEVKTTKRLLLADNENAAFRHQEDVERIIRICAERGYIIDATTARAAWENYSDTMAANWLSLYEDDDLVFEAVMSQCIAVEEEE